MKEGTRPEVPKAWESRGEPRVGRVRGSGPCRGVIERPGGSRHDTSLLKNRPHHTISERRSLAFANTGHETTNDEDGAHIQQPRPPSTPVPAQEFTKATLFPPKRRPRSHFTPSPLCSDRTRISPSPPKNLDSSRVVGNP